MDCRYCGEPIGEGEPCVERLPQRYHRKCWAEFSNEEAAEETDLDAEASWREDVERENPPEGVW